MPATKLHAAARRRRNLRTRPSSTPYGNLQENAMSDQTDLIRGTLDLLTLRTIALEPRLSAGVDLVLERT